MYIMIGIDIAKNTFEAFLHGKARRFANTSSGFSTLVEELGRLTERGRLSGTPYCVMEATGNYSYALAEYLVTNGIAVAIVNPLQVKRYAQMRLQRHKTDRADAALITKYAESQQLGPADQWEPPSEQSNDLRQQQTVLEQLKKQQTALENQLEALERLPRPSRQAQGALKKVLAGVRKAIKELEAAQQRALSTDAPADTAELYRRVLSVPGIGPRAAIGLMILSNCFGRHCCAAQLAAYIGLCPRAYQSGTSVHGSGSIGHSSAPALRSILYMCAVTAIRCNQACRALYERLTSRGKATKLALIAVAHKLLRQVVAVVEQGTPFVDRTGLIS